MDLCTSRTPYRCGQLLALDAFPPPDPGPWHRYCGPFRRLHQHHPFSAAQPWLPPLLLRRSQCRRCDNARRRAIRQHPAARARCRRNGARYRHRHPGQARQRNRRYYAHHRQAILYRDHWDRISRVLAIPAEQRTRAQQNWLARLQTPAGKRWCRECQRYHSARQFVPSSPYVCKRAQAELRGYRRYRAAKKAPPTAA